MRGYLSPNGRVGRRDYLLHYIAPLMALVGLLALFAWGPAVVGFVPFQMAVGWVCFVGGAKRARDIGHPAWGFDHPWLIGAAAAVPFFPLFNFAAFVWLCAVPGFYVGRKGDAAS